MVFKPQWAKTLGIKRPTSYRYWFEWVSADPLVEEVAHYDLDVTPSGKRKLDALGLPKVFPAVVRFKNEQFTSWYFAGDFADLQFSGTPYRMKGIQTIKRLLADDTVDNNSYFFWKVYAPLMHYILGSIERHRAENGYSGEAIRASGPRTRGKGRNSAEVERRAVAHDLPPQRKPGHRRARKVFYEFSF